jgi:hypothetical protein
MTPVTLRTLLTGLKSFNLSAFGFGVGFDKSEHEERLLTERLAALL